MASMLEIPLLPAVIFFLMIAVCGFLAGFVLGGRIGYNDRLRKELETTVEDMQRRTDQYRAARNMPPLTPVRVWNRSRVIERIDSLISRYFWP
jgi:ligand-binding sensor protein